MISPLSNPNIFVPELEIPSSPTSVSFISRKFNICKDFEEIDVTWIKNLDTEFFNDYDECVTYEELLRYCDCTPTEIDFDVILESIKGLFYHISDLYLYNCSSDIKHAIICSSFNLYKEYVTRNNICELELDKNIIFDFFQLTPIICFWISQKYVTNDLDHIIAVCFLGDLSGIDIKKILSKEIEILLYFNYKIRDLMLC
jgi:hypothetical protein